MSVKPETTQSTQNQTNAPALLLTPREQREAYQAAHEYSCSESIEALHIEGYIAEFEFMSKQVALLEERVTKKKQDLRYFSEVLLPEKFAEADLDASRFVFESIDVDNSKEVIEEDLSNEVKEFYLKISPEIHCKINQSRNREAHDWLRQHGYGDKVRREEVININLGSLKAAVRKAIEDGESEGLMKELFGFYSHPKSEIKVSKKKLKSKKTRTE